MAKLLFKITHAGAVASKRATERREVVLARAGDGRGYQLAAGGLQAVVREGGAVHLAVEARADGDGLFVQQDTADGVPICWLDVTAWLREQGSDYIEVGRNEGAPRAHAAP